MVLQSIERLDSNFFDKGSTIYRPLIITTIASYSSLHTLKRVTSEVRGHVEGGHSHRLHTGGDKELGPRHKTGRFTQHWRKKIKARSIRLDYKRHFSEGTHKALDGGVLLRPDVFLVQHLVRPRPAVSESLMFAAARL